LAEIAEEPLAWGHEREVVAIIDELDRRTKRKPAI